MKSLAFRLALVLAVAGAVLVLAMALAHPAAANRAPMPPTTAVRAGAAALLHVKSIGTFSSVSQATLAFQASGRVKEIDVKEGAPVHAGDVIASLDTSTLDLQVAQAQAALDAAQAKYDQLENPPAADVAAAQASASAAQAALAQLKTPTQDDVTIAKSDLDKAKASVDTAQAAYDRIGGASNPFIGMTSQSLALQQATSDYQKALAAYNARISPSDSQLKQAIAAVAQAEDQVVRLTNPSANDLKSAQSAVAQAQAALDLARQNVVNARIVAPFDGVVVWIAPQVGESAAAGTPVATVSDLAHMQVVVGADENALAVIRVGQPATIVSDALPGHALTGKVSKIGLLATTTSGIVSVPVTVDVDAGNTPIAPGLSATVEIDTK